MNTVNSILFYCDEYPPAKSGGIGSVTKIIAEELAGKGFKVLVAGSYEYGTGLPEYSQINGVHIYRFSHFNFLKFFPGSTRNIVKKLARKLGVLSRIAAADLQKNEAKIDLLLKKEKVDVIELVDYIGLLQEIYQPVVLRDFSAPATIRIHGSVSFLNINKGMDKPVQLENDRRNFERAQAISAVSNYSANFVNTVLLQSPRTIEVIYNPIGEKEFDPAIGTTGSNTILFFGKITETKGAFQVLKAFQAIAPAFPDWKLVMLGGGQIQLAEKAILSEYKSKIRLAGYVSRSEVMTGIRNAEFVVIPSYFENFSMAPLEVMAKRKALIYTKRTSGPEIIADGMNGLLVEPDDITDLQDKMRQLIEDQTFREQLAMKGFETVKEQFALGIILGRLVNHYNSLKHG